MKLLLPLLLVLVTWLVPATGLARDAGHFGRELRSAEAISAPGATVPPRLETKVRPPQAPSAGNGPRSPLGMAPAAGSECQSPGVGQEPRGGATPDTEALRPRARRLCFAYEATAPPAGLS